MKLFLALLILGGLLPKLGLAANTPNVLLILVDDLKPVLGCYGDPVAKTPFMDAFAKTALRFDRAYCNQAVCAPSRYTLMLGSRSSSTGLYDLSNNLRQFYPDAVTMPQFFRQHGYRAESIGKIFHIGHGNLGDPDSWSVPHFPEKVIEYLVPASTGGRMTREEALFGNVVLDHPLRDLPRGAAFESPDVPDEAYADGRVAAEAGRRLAAAKKRGEPFFMAVGFARPHMPFCAPKKYWDLYDRDTLPMPKFEGDPAGAPSYAGKALGEVTNYKPVPEKQRIKDDNMKRDLIHGYYASMSYADTQIGKVLAVLDRLDLAKDTIVLLWGDHGFHLGDHSTWTKHTNYEEANRIPIILRAPGVTQPGSSTGQLTETVDLYPTLAELAGLPKPQGPQPMDGLSLMPVLKDPSQRIRDHAYHCYPRSPRLGQAIRTERYRMVEWARPDGQGVADYELYDYQEDPLETKNLAAERPAVMKELKAMLARHAAPKPLK